MTNDERLMESVLCVSMLFVDSLFGWKYPSQSNFIPQMSNLLELREHCYPSLGLPYPMLVWFYVCLVLMAQIACLRIKIFCLGSHLFVVIVYLVSV